MLTACATPPSAISSPRSSWRWSARVLPPWRSGCSPGRLAGDNAGAVLGTALAIKMVAYVTLAPVAAAFAERLPRRAFLVALDLIRAA